MEAIVISRIRAKASANSSKSALRASIEPLAPPSTGMHVHLIVATLAIAGSGAILTLAMNPAFNQVNDFYHEAWPSYVLLAHGHVLEFLRAGPAYFGSLVLRAPFALLPTAWGAGKAASYLASAVPCVIAAAAFCVWLAAQPRRRGQTAWVGRIALIIWCVFNPAVLVAWTGGHPEEVLGAVLCIGGVVLAVKGRVGWAGLLIGLGVVNKPWAVVAVPVALAVMPANRRRGLLVVALSAGAVLIPITLLRAQGFSVSSAGAQLGSQSGSIFNPPQLFWWLGPNSWIVAHARVTIVLVSVACALLWWAQRARARPSTDTVSDALLLLTLVLLLRAALDPWDNIYYHIPFLLALMAYEVRSGRMPLLTVAYAIAFAVVVPVRGYPYMSPDAHAAVYAVMIVPTIAWLVARLYVPTGTWRRLAASTWSQVSRRSPANELTTT